MRRNEVLSLTRRSIDWENCVATLEATKNGETLHLPLNDAAMEALLRHKDGRMTARYSHLSDSHLRKAVDGLNLGVRSKATSYPPAMAAENGTELEVRSEWARTHYLVHLDRRIEPLDRRGTAQRTIAPGCRGSGILFQSRRADS
jgi:integrase